MKIIRSVNNIQLCDVNNGKIDQLDELSAVYMQTCQDYVTAFCTSHDPDKYIKHFLFSPLSHRWHRTAVMQAAGIAKSWRSNRQNARNEHEEVCREALHNNELTPEWHECSIPVLRTPVFQTNIGVVQLGPSHDTKFDYFIKITTLKRYKPLYLPVHLSDYHKKILQDHTINTSVNLRRDARGWWLSLTINDSVKRTTKNDADVIGIDVGIANFLTSSDGKHYGTFHGKLAIRQKKDRIKRKRKSKLRACLKKKGIQKLPSVANARLSRHVRQSINKAVNDFYADHSNNIIAYEKLHVSTMKFKSKQMNAYLHSSNLSHIPNQLVWGAQKRGIIIQAVRSAYSSQECNNCHYTDRSNRKNQQTFCCVVCSYSNHADINASKNIAARYGDDMLIACNDRGSIRALLSERHSQWLQSHQLVVVQLPVQLHQLTDVGQYLFASDKTLENG